MANNSKRERLALQKRKASEQLRSSAKKKNKKKVNKGSEADEPYSDDGENAMDEDDGESQSSDGGNSNHSDWLEREKKYRPAAADHR